MPKPCFLDLRNSTAKFLLLSLISVTATALAAQTNAGDSKSGFGLFAEKSASTKDVGLPLYPGAQIAPDDSHGNSSGQIGFWVGETGFKLVMLKLESTDSADKIAGFYRTALGKYGKVLDCTGVKSSKTEKPESKSNVLTCDDDHDSDGTVLKAGTKDNQHLVGIEEKQGKRHIQLIYLIAQDDKKI